MKLLKDKPEEKDEGKCHGSRGGNQRGYKIEIRSTYHPIIINDDFVITDKWREWPVQECEKYARYSVPVGYLDKDMLQFGLMSETAAQAHRWLLLACLEAYHPKGWSSLETRLVCADFSYSFTTKEVGVSEPIESGLFQRIRPEESFKPREQSTRDMDTDNA